MKISEKTLRKIIREAIDEWTQSNTFDNGMGKKPNGPRRPSPMQSFGPNAKPAPTPRDPNGPRRPGPMSSFGPNAKPAPTPSKMGGNPPEKKPANAVNPKQQTPTDNFAKPGPTTEPQFVEIDKPIKAFTRMRNREMVWDMYFDESRHPFATYQNYMASRFGHNAGNLIYGPGIYFSDAKEALMEPNASKFYGNFLISVEVEPGARCKIVPSKKWGNYVIVHPRDADLIRLLDVADDTIKR